MPNIVANQGRGTGSSFMPRPGEYYLMVNAIGRWNIRAVRVQQENAYWFRSRSLTVNM